MPKVSIIVPVYGVEKYIERCARSLFEQTLDDIEFLFIDDCSLDKSVEILKRVLEEYPHRKSQVVIHRMKQNSGQAIVREWGMRNATGEYVIHCDSDDWVDVNMYKAMYDKAIEEGADVVVCDFERTDLGKFKKKEHGAHTSEVDKFIINCLFQRDHWSLWNKLFKRKVYYNIEYPKGALGEDMVVCIQLLSQCKKMAYVSEVFYFYYVNPTSITKKVSIDNCYKNFVALKENTDILVGFIDNHLCVNKKIKKDAISYLKMVNTFSLLKIRHLQAYKDLWKENFELMPVSFFLNYRIPLYNKLLYCLSFFSFYPSKNKRAEN